MAITPKMLGSGISSGTLQVACNEGAPPFGISNSQGYDPPIIMKKAWLDSSKTHLYVYTNYPESVSIYDISYDSKDRLIMTYNRTIHIPPFKGNSSQSNYINAPIGFICRDNVMYYFYSWNYTHGSASGASSNASLYIVKIEIGESKATVTTKSTNVFSTNTSANMTTRVVTTENSDNIVILCNAHINYYCACKLSTLMTNELKFTALSNNWELFNKDLYVPLAALQNNVNNFTLYDLSSESLINSKFSSDSYYKLSVYLTSACCGIITQYDEYYVFECYIGRPNVSNTGQLYTTTSTTSIQYAVIPYIKNLALTCKINISNLTGAGYVDMNYSFISNTSSYGNISRAFNHTCAVINICGGSEAQVLANIPSVSKYTTVELYNRVSCQNKYFNAINYTFATTYPKGFYANMIAIAHNNKLYGLSITSTGSKAPVGSYLLSVLDYNPDNDEFSQSYSHFKPLVAKSENIQEIVSIVICKTKVKDLIEFDSYGFDYGNDCRIVLRNSTTGEAINIYEGEIKDVFDFSSHPIILNPGYELYVLTTYETWQCTAFGIEIT